MTILATTAHKGGMTAVSRDMGGCGEVHHYEIGPTGYPQIDCSLCENFYRNDPLHATVPSKVPMTYDEKLIKEDLEARSNTRQQTVQAIASARLAGMDAEADMLATLAGIPLGMSGAQCPDGHKNLPGARFCTECGSAITTDEAKRSPCGHVNPASAKFCTECGTATSAPVSAPDPGSEAPDLASLHPATLKKMCRDAKLRDSGTKGDLIKRLQKAQTAAA